VQDETSNIFQLAVYILLLIVYEASVKSIKHMGLVGLVTGGMDLFVALSTSNLLDLNFGKW